jgi:hypothetical protein
MKNDLEIRLMLSPARVQKLTEGPTQHEKQLTPNEVERLRYVEGHVRCVLHNSRGAPRRAGTDPETGRNSPRLKAAAHSIVRIQFRHHRGDAGHWTPRLSLSFPSLLQFHSFTVGGHPGRALIQDRLVNYPSMNGGACKSSC